MKIYIKNYEIKYASDIIAIINGKQIINPTHEQILASGWKEYTMVETFEPTVEDLKRIKIEEIINYDLSPEVNEFTLDNDKIWLDKEMRVGLMNSINIQKLNGEINTILWFNIKSYTIPCDKAIQMLQQLELYAIDCYNTTAQHKANVEKLKTKQEVENYNYKLNYPDKLNFNTKLDKKLTDVIDFIPPMMIEKGKLYKEDGITYECIQSSKSEISNKLKDLVGYYVNIINK